MSVLAAVAGVLAALGVIVMARSLRPAPPRLDAVLARIQPTGPASSSGTAPVGWRDRLGSRLVGYLANQSGLLALPRTDLALLERPTERFVLNKVAYFLAGMLLPSLLLAAVVAAGASLPWALPVLAVLLLAVGLSFLPDINVRAQGRRRRADFRYAFACYLQLVLLEREAGAALSAALEGPLTITETWPFRRIATALDRARRAQQQPWQALADLGQQIGVPDVIDLALSAQIAGTEGAKMHHILQAKITAMRHEAAAATRAEANTRTTAMWVPTSLLMLGFVILIGFPFFARLLGSG